MLNLSVIGAGAIGRIHAQNIAMNSSTQLSFVCDTNLEAASTLSSQYGGVAVKSLEDALGDEVDGVIIASSTASHGDVAKACVKAGKPFLCEKPLARDQSTAAEIVESVRSANLIAGVAFNRRFDPQYSGIRSAVANGEIGPVESIHITSRTASAPTVEFLQSSGGLFGEKGSHFYDLVRWITGEHPVEVFTMGAALINPRFADVGEMDTAVISMRLPSGVLCQFNFSWRAAYGQDERLEVFGAQGMLQNRQEPTEPFTRFTASGMAHNGLMPTWYARFKGTYRIELEAFCKAIETASQGELPSLVDGLAVQQLADAVKQSARGGLPIPITTIE